MCVEGGRVSDKNGFSWLTLGSYIHFMLESMLVWVVKLGGSGKNGFSLMHSMRMRRQASRPNCG